MTDLEKILVVTTSKNIEESIILGNNSNTNHISLLNMLSNSLDFCNRQITASNNEYSYRKIIIEKKIIELYYENDKFKKY